MNRKINKMKLIIFTFLTILSLVYSDELPCNCHLPSLNHIENGQLASDYFVPWITSLVDLNDKHFCTGSIINENHVLTVANCINGKSEDSFYIHVGSYNKKKDDVKHLVEKIINLNYKLTNRFGDLVLLKLKNPIEFILDEIEPACLNFEQKPFSNNLLTVNWSLNENQPTLKYYLSKNSNEKKCPSYDICIKTKKNNNFYINGNTGSPLMYSKNDKTSIIGIASMIKNKEDMENYKNIDLYARLSLFRSFIKLNAGKYCIA